MVAFGESYESWNAYVVWARINSLRMILDTDKRLKDLNNSDDMTPRLDEGIVMHLDGLVQIMNVFASFEPTLAMLDSCAVDPSVRQKAKVDLESARIIANEVARNLEVATPELAKHLAVLLRDMHGDGPMSDRVVVSGVETSKNISNQLVEAAVEDTKKGSNKFIDSVKGGVGREAGSQATRAVIKFLSDHYASILRLMPHDTHSIIEHIVRIFHNHP
jgi:hypothetical protein